MLIALLLGATRVCDPSLEPVDVEAHYRAWALGQGRPPERAELVCRSFTEAARLCFVWRAADRRVYLTRADGLEVAGAEALARVEAGASLEALKAQTVEGMTGTYWLRAEGDGRDHAPLLAPEALAAKVGAGVVVGVPNRGALVAWVPGDPAFDRVVAAGVYRMHTTLPDPVTEVLFQWDGTDWKVWGRVRESPPPPP